MPVQFVFPKLKKNKMKHVNYVDHRQYLKTDRIFW